MFGKERAPALLLGGSSAAAVLLLLCGLFFGGPVTASANPPQDCGVNVAYAAYDQPVGSKHFGPDQTGNDVAVMTARFQYKLCSDALFAAAAVLHLEKGVEATSQSEIMDLARRFVADRKAWADRVKSATTGVTYNAENISAHYETLGMAISSTDRAVMPMVLKLDSARTIGWALVARTSTGSRIFRWLCDLQPSALSIGNIPTTTPPTTPPPPQRCTDAAKPSEAEHTYAPVRGRNGCILRWVIEGSSLDGSRAQVVQEDRGDQADKQQQEGSIGTSPQAAVQGPTAGEPAPSNNGAGYTSGGATGTSPGGSATDTSGTTSGTTTPTNGSEDSGQGGSGNAGTGGEAP